MVFALFRVKSNVCRAFPLDIRVVPDRYMNDLLLVEVHP